MSSVCELYRRPEKGVRLSVDTLTVGSNGVEGDAPVGELRQVSLCDAAVLAALTDAPGLCTRKYVANVTTKGLAYAALTRGQRLTVGEVPFTVTRVGKDCYPACERYAARGVCALRTGCAFLTPAGCGSIRTGDPITVQG